MWAEGSNRPENGSFSILKNQNGMVVPEFVWYIKYIDIFLNIF